MGNLPENRVKQSRPFLHIGVDYCGPFIIKDGGRRSKLKTKVYVSIFVCPATKAIHVELAKDLTSEGFLACLRRFISRRGKPSEITSDNATNFFGANRELRKQFQNQLFQSKVYDSLASEGIKWTYIPPRAPHFGGLWESAVKSFKHHLKPVTAAAFLTYSDLNTLVCQIESILNSRPITAMSSDPNDLTYLAPSHFLIGDLLTAVPEPDLRELKISHLSRWQHVLKLKQHFWQRWKKEYLHQLQQRHKWKNSTTAIQVGDLVIVCEDNVPPKIGA